MNITYFANGDTYHDADNDKGAFGMQKFNDRRFWVAWSGIGSEFSDDILRGVMDDFGTLVDTDR